ADPHRRADAGLEPHEVPVLRAPAAWEGGQRRLAAGLEARAPPRGQALAAAQALAEALALAAARGVDRLEAGLARLVAGGQALGVLARVVALRAHARVVALQPAVVALDRVLAGDEGRGRGSGDQRED